MVNKTKQIQQLMPQKPAAPKPLTKEEQAQQIARFFQQKRESYFQMILANAIQADYKNVALKQIVDESLEAADYAIEKLFPLPKPEEPAAK